MNIVALVGNVASEPELRQTTGGRAVCTFRLAVSRVGAEQADFFTIVAWERQAEVCGQYLGIGRRIAVDGRLHHTSWEADGARRSRVEVVAHRVELLGKPRQASPFDAGQAADAAPAPDATPPCAEEGAAPTVEDPTPALA